MPWWKHWFTKKSTGLILDIYYDISQFVDLQMLVFFDIYILLNDSYHSQKDVKSITGMGEKQLLSLKISKFPALCNHEGLIYQAVIQNSEYECKCFVETSTHCSSSCLCMQKTSRILCHQDARTIHSQDLINTKLSMQENNLQEEEKVCRAFKEYIPQLYPLYQSFNLRIILFFSLYLT